MFAVPPTPLALPVLGPVAVVALALLFLRSLWPHRDRPGGWLFLATIAGVGALAAVEAASFLVFDPALRSAFEAPRWALKAFVGVAFLAFALAYTGRSHLVRSGWMAAVAAVPPATAAVVATNGWHGLAYRDYRVEPTLGAATVSYDPGPLMLAAVGFVLVVSGVAIFLLVDAFASYGRLYRSQTAALALSPLPPLAAGTASVAGVGPVGSLDFTVTSLLVHLTLDYYAFFRRDMFELTPATRRVAERSALEAVGAPMVVLDDAGRVVEFNDAAGDLFDAGDGDAGVLGRRFGVLLDAEGDAVGGGPDDAGEADDPGTTGDDAGAGEATDAAGDGERWIPGVGDGSDPDGDGSDPGAGGVDVVTVRTADGRRQYAVSTSPVEDAAGTRVGDTVLLQDVTEQNRRRQRLAVLNRVLRHNLRNEVTAIAGHGEVIRDRTEDPAIERSASVVVDRGHALADLGDQARRFQEAVERDAESRRVALGEFLTDVVEDVRANRAEDADAGAGAAPDGTERTTSSAPGDGPPVGDRADSGPAVELDDSLAGVAVESDPELLELVFSNLVENALAAADRRVELAVAERDPAAGTVTVAVRDDGPGIPESELAPVRDGDETALGHASGLGLWVVRWSVQALGGTVSFEVGEGTTVAVELPGLLAEAGAGDGAGEAGTVGGDGAGVATADGDGGVTAGGSDDGTAAGAGGAVAGDGARARDGDGTAADGDGTAADGRRGDATGGPSRSDTPGE